LLDVESVAGHLLKPGSVFAFLAVHRRELFPDGMFTDLFPSRQGRPSVPADVMATVITLQALQGLSDSETVDAVTFDLRWKAACGLAVTDTSFHATTLTYWRRRLAASKSPDRIFDAVRAVIKQTGVIKGKTRRVLDSTVLDDAVATQDTVTQLVAAIRRVLRVVPGAQAVLVGRETACDYTRPGKPEIAWEDKAAKAALVNALVLDALTLLNALSSNDTDADAGRDDADEAAQALALLALLAGQDVEWIDDGTGGGVWRIARKVAHDRVISTVDTETRHAHKSLSRRQDGFKAHIAAEPDTGLITNAALTKATGAGTGDAAAGAAVLAGDDSFTEPGQVLADSAYGTGDLLADLQQAGHEPVIKPWPCTPNIPGGFGVDDFTVDHDTMQVTCPAGNTASFTAKTRTAKFGTACAACPFRDQCTTAAAGRSVTVNIHDKLQRAHRARWNTDPQMRADYRKHRPMVERSIAWLTRGVRRLRYRGVTKNDAWLKLRAGGINLRQLCATGLTHTPGGWEIAT
jgi:IS5 family transposase